MTDKILSWMRGQCMTQPGDTVTLSPACSSFDFFKNFAERGDTFRAIVEGLQ